MTDQRWMTIQGVLTELAGYWGEAPSEATIRRWCSDGTLREAIVQHGGWRVPRDSFVAFMRAGRPRKRAK